MEVFQSQLKSGTWTKKLPQNSQETKLVLLFGGTELIKQAELIDEIKKSYPKAEIAGCSTAGEILEDHVYDESVILSAISFNDTEVLAKNASIENSEQSFSAGQDLARSLEKENLKHVLIFSDGLSVNGTELVKGIDSILGENVSVTGGLSGDGDRFSETYVICNDKAKKNQIAAVGLYGKNLKIGYGSLGGWDPFGPERKITKSKGNILYELDGRPALEIYKEYLGPEHSKALPASALMFPLALKHDDHPNGLVRTILSVDEENKSMTFAGDVAEGAHARLMRTNVDHLIDGATEAANKSLSALGNTPTTLALMISCVGRKIVMKQLVDEEIESARQALGNPAVAGFYSYGEICPFGQFMKCELHNQTMTITSISED